MTCIPICYVMLCYDIISRLPVKHWRVYTRGWTCTRCLYQYSHGESINNGLTNKWDAMMGQRKNLTPKPDLQPTGHLVSGQVPHLAATPCDLIISEKCPTLLSSVPPWRCSRDILETALFGMWPAILDSMLKIRRVIFGDRKVICQSLTPQNFSTI